MSHIAELTTGDDITFPVQLTKDTTSFTISNLAIVRASIISKDKRLILIPPIPVLETNIGSNWASSLIMVSFTSAQTILIKNYGSNLLEIQVNDNGKHTWFTNINILQGTII